MATLTAGEVVELRQAVANTLPTVRWTKAQALTILQAIENSFESFRPTLSAAIDTASTPLTLTAAEKKQFVRWYLQFKFRKESV